MAPPANNLADVGTAEPRRRAYHDALKAAHVEFTRVEDICKATGLSKRTVMRWRAVPAWWVEVEDARGELLQEAIARLRNKMPAFADELAKIAVDPNEPGSTRVQAIKVAREQFSGLTETADHGARLKVLEQAAAKQPTGEGRHLTALQTLTGAR